MGRIARAHGLKGELVVELVSDREERRRPGARLFAGTTPVTVVAARPHQGRWLMHLAEVTDRSSADALRGVLLYGEPIDDPDALWVHELVGSRCVDDRGIDRGRVVAVVENPAADLLELESGVLVPVVFVLSCRDGVTRIEPPTDLFD